MFDIDPKVVGEEIYGIKVYHVDELYEFCRRNEVTIGVLTVPKEAAYNVAMIMAHAGVKGIWNFANMELELEDRSVTVENIHLGDSLMILNCRICRNDSAEDGEESSDTEL